MGYGGSLSGCAAGDERDLWLSWKIDAVGGAVRLIAVPVDFYRNRFVGIFSGGVLRQIMRIPTTGPLVVVLPVEPGNDQGSVWISDFGDWPYLPGDIPDDNAKLYEVNEARRIGIRWTAQYDQAAVQGAAQLASLVVTGAKRSQNVEPVPGWPTRGRLWITLTTSGTTHIVRLWATGKLVAEGSRTGNGAVTLAERNGSGLSATTTLTYSADIPFGDAFLDIRWPASYQIHYSTSSLSYPRTPEATVTDNGSDEYSYLSPVLTAGAYNFNVLTVDDDGTAQTIITAPAESPLTVNAAITPAQIISVTGSAAAGLTVSITPDYVADSSTLYYSDVNEPINYRAALLPTPINNVSFSKTTAAITGYAPTDLTAAWATLVATIDAAVVTANAAFDAGQDGFAAAFTTLTNAVAAAIATFDTDGTGYTQLLEDMAETAAQVQAQFDAIDLPDQNGDDLDYLLGQGEQMFVTDGNAAPIGAFPDTSTSWTDLETVGIVISSVTNSAVNQATLMATISEDDYFQVIGATSSDYAFYRIGTVENMPGDSQIRLTNLALQYSGGTYPGDFDPVTIKFYESNQGALLLDETEWATAAGVHYGNYIGYLSGLIGGNVSRYTFGSGAIPGGVSPGIGDATGSATDGSAGTNVVTNRMSLYDLAQPFLRPGIVRCVVRMKKSGIEETQDTIWEVELDASGNIVSARPNVPEIQSFTAAGLALTVNINVREIDAATQATRVYLHIKDFDPDEPISVAHPGTSGYTALTALVDGQGENHSASVTLTAGAQGYYWIAARAYTGGTYSAFTPSMQIYLDNTAPSGVVNLTGDVVRSIATLGS